METIITTCPVCHTEDVDEVSKKYLWGLITTKQLLCKKCLAKFTTQDTGLRLVSTNEQNSPVWISYGKQTLTVREWKTIEKGGMSDVKQREADIVDWFLGLQRGSIKSADLQKSKPYTPIILKTSEEVSFVIPNVTLKESRAVRVTSGGYAGPSIRVAKGVSFRLGRFGSTSESHQEIRDIDTGFLTLTNHRVVFSGGFKTISVLLEKIIQIDPFSDGVSLHKENREKTQYFLWKEPFINLDVSIAGRKYTEPLSGLVFQSVIQGLRRTSK